MSERIESSEMVPLFPTFVHRVQLAQPAYRRINGAVSAKLRALYTLDGPLPPNSRWQTGQRLHRHEELRELCGVVLEAADAVLRWQRVVHTGLRITGCWANISSPGAAHRSHNHPNNYLSAVYYVKAGDGARHIVFEDPRPQTNVISPAVSALVESNAGEIHLGVGEGMLVMFPAWLSHYVPENRSSEDRVSVAFNLMFERFGEEMAQPKWEGNLPDG